YIRHGVFLPPDNFTASLDYIFVGDRADLNPVTFGYENNPAYHRFDLVAAYETSWRWRSVRKEEIFTRVENLFDRNYSEVIGFKAPTVNFVAGIKLDFE
ncbi:MAG: hypothetical protein ACREP6_13955, partial [Candidatus Binataceae bacterium]